MMQDNFFLYFLNFSMLSIRYIKISLVRRREIWFAKARVCYTEVHYTEMIYQTFVRVKQREMDFGS